MKQDNQVLNFGKYKSQTLSHVVTFDKNYLVWLSKNAFDVDFQGFVEKFLTEYEKTPVVETVPSKNDDTIFKFGKHRGKTYRQVYRENPRYFNWVLRTFTEDTVLIESITTYLDKMKPIKKRLNKIIAFQNKRQRKIDEDNKLMDYILRRDTLDLLYKDISNLDRDKFYITKVNNMNTFFKIKDVSIIKRDDSYQVVGYIVGEIEIYYYDWTVNDMIKDLKPTKEILNVLPTEYEFDYDILYRIDTNLYDTDGILLTNGNPDYKITSKTVRVMSDVWDDVYTLYYKKDFVHSWGVYHNNSKNSISIKNKYIVCKLQKNTNIDLVIRMKKIMSLKEKLK